MSKNTNATPLEGEISTGPLSAAEVRSSIFAKAGQLERRPFTFNGVSLEFLQPKVGSMFNQTADESGEAKSFIVMTMIKNTVAPGTTERVFEDTDYDSIMEMPMTGEIQQVTTIINELMGIGIDDKAKN